MPVRRHTGKPGDGWGTLISRCTWRVLAAVEVMNLLDWATTMIGAGILGVPERGQTTIYLVRHLGVVGGTTVIKLLAAAIFAAFGAAALRLAGAPKPGSTTAAVGLLSGLAYAGVMLTQTVLSNLIIIWQKIGGR